MSAKNFRKKKNKAAAAPLSYKLALLFHQIAHQEVAARFKVPVLLDEGQGGTTWRWRCEFAPLLPNADEDIHNENQFFKNVLAEKGPGAVVVKEKVHTNTIPVQNQVTMLVYLMFVIIIHLHLCIN